jgi:hypothetical protein
MDRVTNPDQKKNLKVTQDREKKSITDDIKRDIEQIRQKFNGGE